MHTQPWDSFFAKKTPFPDSTVTRLKYLPNVEFFPPTTYSSEILNNYFEIYWIILKNPQKFYTKPKRFINWTKMSLLRLEFVFWYTAPSLLRTFLTSFLSPIFSLSFFVLWSEVTKIFLCSVPRMLFTLVVQLYGKAPPLRISTPIKVDVFEQKLNTWKLQHKVPIS